MHDSAMDNARRFFETYCDESTVTIVDIGSQDVNGSLRTVAPPQCQYIGVDFVPGRGVDVIIEDPYRLPFESNSVDIIVSSSCFEHSEMFWVLFLEMLRILKPTGLAYVNAPSKGPFHRYPVDCWRFYPDSGKALATWARRNAYNATLLESYIDKSNTKWNDFVGVFLKDEAHLPNYRHRILDTYSNFSNGFRYGEADIIQFEKDNWTQPKRAGTLARLKRSIQKRLGVS